MSDSAHRALEYLAAHRVMTLATHGPDGLWAAAVFYANEGFEFYFVSSAQSRHSRDLLLRPTVAAAVHEDYEDWREIKGIQLEGMVDQLSGTEQQRARELYVRKFPFTASTESTPAALAAALAGVRWYRLQASRAYFIDNSVRFGHRDQVFLRSE